MNWPEWAPFPENPIFYMWTYNHKAATNMSFFEQIGTLA